MRAKVAGLLILLGGMTACSSGPGGTLTTRFDFDFANGQQGWEADFADYPRGQETFYDLTSDYRVLPVPLNSRSGVFISGNNHSDDLFMYLRKRVGGLEPGSSYRAAFVVEFATDVPGGCLGAGGSPGESVYVKTGASTIQPGSVVDGGGFLRMNIDKGNQAQGGANAVVVGNVANSTLCSQQIKRYEMKELRSVGDVVVTADSTGSVWLMVGTDSGFEATTTLYYSRISAELSRE